MKLFITNIPSFYKINLFNRINEIEPIKVIYTCITENGRNNDFYKGKMYFEYNFLSGNTISKICSLYRIIKSENFREVIIDGWDSPLMLLSAFVSDNENISVIVESTIFESRTKGVRATIKKLFLSRINKAYVCGAPHRRLMEALKFKGRIVETYGVGVFNCVDQPAFVEKTEVKNFLFVGRLVEVKNLPWLFERFNEHPELNLTIIGFGEQETLLKSLIKGDNITILGAVENTKLSVFYKQADVFILPSISETWGLVVEEALNNGIPVMVSDRVGCCEDLVNTEYGVIFTLTRDGFENGIKKITDPLLYNKFRKNISLLDFSKIEKRQVDCYLK